MRASGVLLPIFSLPSPYGIGTLGKEAFLFVDFLKKAGQRYWQILPLNPTNYGDSPYQSFSSAAGNPYFIDLDTLCEEGLLKQKEFAKVDFGSGDAVDYEKLYRHRLTVLKKAYARFDKSDGAYSHFCHEETEWLEEYVLFMALKEQHGGKSWRQWEEPLKFREPKALAEVRLALADTMDFYRFLQFKFYRQWHALKEYANKQGVEIIGDMPIYVADDSVDVWANTAQFDLDDELLPRVVAGCPPDAFCEEGQLWGMPVYHWQYMQEEVVPYRWWRQRMKRALRVYDVVRIDHFRGLESFYCIPYGAKTAKSGVWRKGPGMDLIRALKSDYGSPLPIIAEDLGFSTQAVIDLLAESGFPGMKILQFAFNPHEESEYLPHNHPKNCVVYTGTHDNDTVLGWASTATAAEPVYAKQYLNVKSTAALPWAMIRAAMMSTADTAIVPMADCLGLGSEARINTPSTLGNNWQWRMSEGAMSDELAKKLRKVTEIYCRLAK